MSNRHEHDDIDITAFPFEKQREILLSGFDGDEREAVAELIDSLDKDKLSDDSLRLVVDEYILTKRLGSDTVNLARDNADLREKVRNERKTKNILLAAITGCIFVILLLLYFFAIFPKYSYLQTKDNSVICEIDPKDNPLLTDVAIQDFAKSAILSAYSFDYVNYRDSVETATTRYFTSEGRAAFNKALKSSGSLAYIINNQLIMRTFAISTPQIEEKGKDNSGEVYWIVRMPITTEFYAGSSKAADSQSFVAQVRIVVTKRDAFNPRGLGVYSMTLRPYKSN